MAMLLAVATGYRACRAGLARPGGRNAWLAFSDLAPSITPALTQQRARGQGQASPSGGIS